MLIVSLQKRYPRVVEAASQLATSVKSKAKSRRLAKNWDNPLGHDHVEDFEGSLAIQDRIHTFVLAS